jgi:hypothetical protein
LNDDEVTLAKLRELEGNHAAPIWGRGAHPHARQLSLRSVKRMINQMTEGIACFEAKAAAR